MASNASGAGSLAFVLSYFCFGYDESPVIISTTKCRENMKFSLHWATSSFVVQYGSFNFLVHSSSTLALVNLFMAFYMIGSYDK